MRYHLAIIKSRDTLTAVVLRARLTSPGLAAIFRRETGDGPQNALAALRKDCESAGYGGAWNNIAMLCLGAEDAVFHDFMLPTANTGMAKKTMPLLLESEFPFDPAEFALDTRFFRYGDKKQLGALATLLSKEVLEEWQSALEGCGLPGARVFVSPWPLISCLRTHGKSALLLCFSGKKCTAAALDASGNPMRIQTFPASSDKMAVEARRKCGLLLSGLPFRASCLILAGEALPAGIEEKFGRAFDMPAMRARDNARLTGNPDSTGNSDFAWLQAVGMFRQSLFAKTRVPFFALRMKKNAGSKSARGLWLAAGYVLLLCAVIGTASFLDSLEYRAKANILRAGMLEKLRGALPDAPKNAGMGKLRAILKSRLGQYESGANAEARPIVLEIMENIHAAVPASLDIDVHRLVFDDKHVRIYGHAGSYDDVNAMKEKLEGVKGIAGTRIVNAANRAGKDRNNRAMVEFELDLARMAAP